MILDSNIIINYHVISISNYNNLVITLLLIEK